MSSVTKLRSPIELPIHHRQIYLPYMRLPIEEGKPGEGFVKYGHPNSVVDRYFIELEPAWSGIHAIEFTENAPIAYVQKYPINRCMIVRDRLMETTHPNLVNLKETFITETSLFFIYDKWGMSLKEIYQLWPVFRLGEVEVATICREVILKELLLLNSVIFNTNK